MITGSPRIDVLVENHPRDHMCSALGVPRTSPSVELRYELLRAVTWASTGGRVPVSTRTLLDRAMDADAALMDSNVDNVGRRQVLRDCLEELATIGDIAALGRGQWLSVPGAVVRLTNSTGVGLLVSGVPLLHLDPEVRSSIHLDGATRRLSDLSISERLALPVIEVDDWIARPRQPLSQWTDGRMSMPLPLIPETVDLYSLKVYVPARARRGAPDSDRWFGPDTDMQGRHLARISVLGESSQYHVVNISGGEVLQLGAELSHDVARLMYGLDVRDGNPTVAQWTTTDASAQLRVARTLPSAEARALVAIAGPLRDREWTIRRDISTVRQLLTGLGIELAPSSTSTTPNASRRKTTTQQQSRR